MEPLIKSETDDNGKIKHTYKGIKFTETPNDEGLFLDFFPSFFTVDVDLDKPIGKFNHLSDVISHIDFHLRMKKLNESNKKNQHRDIDINSPNLN